MHFVISWDIQAEGEEWKNANDTLKKCLSGYSWVKPLTTLYIVKIRNEEAYDSIKESLKEVASTASITIHFVVTPIMYGGRYDGWLPDKMWPMIRERAQDDE